MKEFFEAFSIKKVRECELRDECFLGFAHTCDKCDIYGQAYEVYPPITSDIVLGLERIILDNQGNIIYLMELLDDYYCLCGDDYQYPTNEGRGTTRLNALLQLCIKLKHEISEEVKALFKC